MQKSNGIIYLFLVISMLCWGTSYVFSSICLPSISPMLLVTIRLLISAALLWGCIFLFYRQHRISWKDFRWLLLLAFFEPFIYFIGETYGLQRVSPIVTSLMVSTIPIFTAISMRMIFHEPLTKIRIVGIGISFTGVLCMLVNSQMQLDADPIGLLFLLLAIFSAVAYGMVLNKSASNVHPVLLVAIQNTLGALYFIPCCVLFRAEINIVEVQAISLPWEMSPQVLFWTCVGILTVFSSSLAFIFYSIGVKRIGIARSNVFTNLIPIFTALTSFILLNERLTPLKTAGIAIVICGLVLTQKKKKTALPQSS